MTGQGEYNRIRSLSYRGENVSLVVFSLISKASYKNISKNWIPELRRYTPSVPILLAEKKLDLWKDKQFFVDHPGAVPISIVQGENLKRKIEATEYIECSYKTQQHVKVVFDVVIKVILQPPKQKKHRNKKRTWFIL